MAKDGGSNPELPRELTLLLHRAATGDAEAAEAAFEELYSTLQSLARQKFAHERRSHTLGATALVNELYLKLFGPAAAATTATTATTSSAPGAGVVVPRWRSREHFFRAAAEAMQNLLIDHARRRNRKKRGGGKARLDLETVTLTQLVARDESPERFDDEDVLRLDAAMSKLKAQLPDAAAVVQMKYFAGMTNEEAADVLAVSVETVKRRWRLARAFLGAELGASGDE